MPTSSSATTTSTATTAAAVTTSRFADCLVTRRVSRERCIAEHGWKKTSRQPIVYLVTEAATIETVAALREAVRHILAHTIEIADIRSADFSAADIVLFASNDLTFGRHADVAARAGAIPVIAEKAAPKAVCADYEPTSESGNAFFARSGDAWALFAALVRAVETFRFSYDWNGIIRNAIK